MSIFFFTKCILELLQAIVDTHVGCTIAGAMVNVLVYADNIVLLASSWVALQFLIVILDYNIKHIDIVCNISRTQKPHPWLSETRILIKSQLPKFPDMDEGLYHIVSQIDFKHLSNLLIQGLSLLFLR